MLGKIILALIALGLALFLLRRALGGTKPSEPASKAQDPGYVRLRSCRICGAHVPQSEAILRGEHAYCGIAHAQQGESE